MEKEPEKIIELVNVKKIYRMGNEKIYAVDDVSFDIKKGEFCCLLGTSGSGKSTLLNLMAGIEKVTSGTILIKGKQIPKMSENSLARFRQRYLGFVFQSYNLLNSMTALENVEFPLVFKRVPLKKRKRLAKDMLVKVGLGSRLHHKPKEMSGGQQQRVGIARAFVAKPEIVFADEPTGNLDSKTTIEVMELIRQMARDNNQTIVMVTHDRSLAVYADKVIHILDGKIQRVEEPSAEKVRETVAEPEAERLPETVVETEVTAEPKAVVETETAAEVKTEEVADIADDEDRKAEPLKATEEIRKVTQETVEEKKTYVPTLPISERGKVSVRVVKKTKWFKIPTQRNRKDKR